MTDCLSDKFAILVANLHTRADAIHLRISFSSSISRLKHVVTTVCLFRYLTAFYVFDYHFVPLAIPVYYTESVTFVPQLLNNLRVAFVQALSPEAHLRATLAHCSSQLSAPMIPSTCATLLSRHCRGFALIYSQLENYSPCPLPHVARLSKDVLPPFLGRIKSAFAYSSFMILSNPSCLFDSSFLTGYCRAFRGFSPSFFLAREFVVSCNVRLSTIAYH